MKKLLFALLLVSGIASAQYTPTGSKTRFVNGIGLGTKSDAAFGTVDSLVLYASADSTLKFKFKGTARALMYAANVGAQIHDSLYAVYQLKAGTSAGARLVSNSGTVISEWGLGGSANMDFHGFAGYDANRSASYTDRSFTDKGYVDSLGALKQPIFTQGLSGYIPKWTSASGLDTSQIKQEGGNILIGGASNDGTKLAILGTIKVTGNGGITGALAVSSRVMVNNATDDGLTALQVNGNTIIKGGGNLFANTTKTNTPDPSNIVGNIVGSGGYWAIRTATDNSFNIDTYNSGSALNAVKVEQDGIVTLANRIKTTQYRLSALNTAPSSASDTGTLGEIRIDASYIYICTATNTWKRVAIATW